MTVVVNILYYFVLFLHEYCGTTRKETGITTELIINVLQHTRPMQNLA